MKQEMQTPLARARGLGSAKDGTHHWIAQRLSAVGLVFLGLWLLFTMMKLKGLDYSAIKPILGSPLNAAGLFLFIVVASYHSMLGLQVIVEDYYHSAWLKYVGLVKAKFFGYLLPALSLFFLIKIMG